MDEAQAGGAGKRLSSFAERWTLNPERSTSIELPGAAALSTSAPLGLHVALAQAAGDDDLLDLARAVVDARHAQVAPDALDHVLVVDVAVAAEDLHGVVDRLPGALGGEILRRRRLADRL